MALWHQNSRDVGAKLGADLDVASQLRPHETIEQAGKWRQEDKIHEGDCYQYLERIDQKLLGGTERDDRVFSFL